MKKMMNLMKTFIKIIYLMVFSKLINKIDMFARIVLVLNLIFLILDILKLNIWLLFDLMIVIYFGLYLYFKYVENE